MAGAAGTDVAQKDDKGSAPCCGPTPSHALSPSPTHARRAHAHSPTDFPARAYRRLQGQSHRQNSPQAPATCARPSSAPHSDPKQVRLRVVRRLTRVARVGWWLPRLSSPSGWTNRAEALPPLVWARRWAVCCLALRPLDRHHVPPRQRKTRRRWRRRQPQLRVPPLRPQRCQQLRRPPRFSVHR